MIPIIGWGVLLSIVAIGYLVKLEIRQFLSNRRLNAHRQRLGLPPV
jgi:hypothetical protein